jgi:type II secretory pathway component GspD/PulD (secretin)
MRRSVKKTISLLLSGMFLFFCLNLFAQTESLVEGQQLGEKDGRITLDLKDTDLKDVLRTISKTSDLNIVAGDEINGKVTARLSEVKVFEALSTILRSCGYSYIQEGDVVRVVKIDPKLLGIDEKTPQVLMESKLVEVTLDKSHQTGINWKKFKMKFDNHVTVNDSVNLPIVGSGADKGLFVSVFDGDIDVLMQFLNEESKTDILSSPRIVALDNKEAQILVGEKVPYQQTFGQTTAGITSTSILFEDVGIKLLVTPHVREKDFVILDIHAEVSSVTEWKTLSAGNELPIISTKQAQTEVIVKDSTTLVLGGLISEGKWESVSKVPILGDIPILSYFFKHKSWEKKKSELVVLITPKIFYPTAE